MQEAFNLPLARAIKPAVRCPLIVVGGIRSVWTAKRIVRRGEADYIALSRPLVQEPGLAQRWRWAEGDTLARCRSCNACFKAALRGSVKCMNETVKA
jgi:2,4-dienoyl-CoA reductase-like NADH-dependent reductase (Old Yellow Enzyme family)